MDTRYDPGRDPATSNAKTTRPAEPTARRIRDPCRPGQGHLPACPPDRPRRPVSANGVSRSGGGVPVTQQQHLSAQIASQAARVLQLADGGRTEHRPEHRPRPTRHQRRQLNLRTTAPLLHRCLTNTASFAGGSGTAAACRRPPRPATRATAPGPPSWPPGHGPGRTAPSTAPLPDVGEPAATRYRSVWLAPGPPAGAQPVEDLPIAHSANNAPANSRYTVTRAGTSRTRRSTVLVAASTSSTISNGTIRVTHRYGQARTPRPLPRPSALWQPVPTAELP